MEHGGQMLSEMAQAPRFNRWMADTIRPFCGSRVLEIGAGIGNLTRELTRGPFGTYTATDIDVQPGISYCDVTKFASFPAGDYDTVVCLNVLEHIADDQKALANMRRMLGRDGRTIILVPQGPWNFGTLDEVVGHQRRYTQDSLYQLALACGMRITNLIPFNRLGTVAWFLNGKILKRQNFGGGQLHLLNLIAPVMRRIDAYLPIPPLSLVAVMERS